MRAIYKVAMLVVLGSASIASSAQQSAFFQEVFTQARPGARVDPNGSKYHQIAWVTSGGPGACLLSLDFSNDGMVWSLGQVIEMRDCTRSGSSSVAHAAVRYVRMNLNSLSPTAAIRATYTGFQSNPGPTGTVTSVFGRTGDVVAVSGDYNVSQITGAAGLFSPNFTGHPTAPNPAPSDNSNQIATTSWVTAHCASCGGGGGGGLGGSGTANVLSKFTASTTLGNSLLTDDGTTLTYTGSGGIVAPAVTVTGGPFKLESVTGALPSLPGAGKNSLVSGPDGWYVSNANGAFIGPLGAGGGGGGGAVLSVFGRTGPVTANASDYDQFYLPTNNAAMAGTPTAPTANQTTNDDQVATTAFVHAAVAAGGGGGGTPTPIPIGHSALGNGVCKAQNSGGNLTFTSTDLVGGILENDTVFVAISFYGTPPTPPFTVTDNATPSSPIYSLEEWNNVGTSNVTALYATPPSGAHAATTLTISYAGANKYAACVITYKGIASFAQPTKGGAASSATSASPSLTTTGNNSWLFVVIGITTPNTLTQSTPRLLVQQATSSPSAAAVGICESGPAATPGTLSCGVTFPSSGFNTARIELVCCSTTGPPLPASAFPRVEKYQDYPVSAAAMADTTLCSSTDCSPGFYRLAWSLIALTDCSGTGGTIIPRVKFTDERTAARDHALIETSPFEFSFAPHAPGPWADGQLILHVTGGSIVLHIASGDAVACSTGAVSGHLHVALERLQ